MKTYQDFINEVRQHDEPGEGPPQRYGDYHGRDRGSLKPLDLSWIHKISAESAKKSAEARKKRMKELYGEEFVDPEHGETPSGRSPLQNVSDHPNPSVRRRAVKGFKKQMGKEYGGRWSSRGDDPVHEEHIDELFITRKTPEQKKEEKRKKLLRLITHMQDPHSDVSKRKVNSEEYSEKN